MKKTKSQGGNESLDEHVATPIRNGYDIMPNYKNIILKNSEVILINMSKSFSV